MATKIIGIECGYSSMIVEIPFNDKVDVEIGDEVIFKDAENKEEYGIVQYLNRPALEEDKVVGGGKILRKATANDIQKVESFVDSANYALEKGKDIVEKLKLDMNIFRAGYSFDGNCVHFTFTADDRIDFRDLVKDLAKTLQKQIYLRQIGPRDKAKLVGGYGKCGRSLCCNVWLDKFESINMDMVRVQALESKGSSKLSGSCGKLLCCLKYEVESYKEVKKNLPLIGSTVRLKKSVVPVGNIEGLVIALDILNQKFKVFLGGGESVIVGLKDVEKILKRPKDDRTEIPEEASEAEEITD